MSEKWTDEQLAYSIYDRYQRMIRHPEYRSFCNKYEQYFEKDQYSGIIKHFKKHQSIKNFATEEDNQYLLFNCPDHNDSPNTYEAFNKIRKRFGTTSTISHYHHPFSKDDMSQCPPFEKPLAVDFRSRLENDHIRFVHDNHYLHANIDISPEIPINQILTEMKIAITEGRFEIDAETKRNHLNKSDLKYQVWDLRYDRLSFNKIAIKINKPRQTAYSIFKKAWFDIIGEEYDPEKFINTLLAHGLREKSYAGLNSKDTSIENRYARKVDQDQTSEDVDSNNLRNKEDIAKHKEEEYYTVTASCSAIDKAGCVNSGAT